jgi:hypothetical protein
VSQETRYNDSIVGALNCASNEYTILQKQNYDQFVLAIPNIDWSILDNPEEKKLQIVLYDNRPIGVVKQGVRQYRNWLAWEISGILHLEKYVCPALLFNDRLVFQGFLPVQCGFLFGGHDVHLIQMVSLLDYWLANICAYILGMADLPGTNIFVNDYGQVYFIDNEDCLSAFQFTGEQYVQNKNIDIDLDNWYWKDHCFITNFYYNAMLDWPQLNMPLTAKEAELIQDKINWLKNCKTKLLEYKNMMSNGILLTYDELSALLNRLDEVSKYTVREGDRFENFLNYLFPYYACGVIEMKKVMQTIYGRDFSVSQSYLILAGYKQWYNFSFEQQELLEKWIKNRSSTL